MKKIYRKLIFFGFDVKKFVSAFKNTRWFYDDLKEFTKQRGCDMSFELSGLFPILNEKEEQGGVMNGHYFHQDLYVARKIFETNPKRHLDIGSRTDGFVAHVACFREIELIDIRDINSTVKNISFKKADLMKLPSDLIEKFDSISSLHAIEHFGLGRYGDPIDYWGHLKAIENIKKLLIKGGKFYFSVPIGPQRIEFNAHRVFSVDYILTLFSKDFNLITFSYVDDKGNFFDAVNLIDSDLKNNFGCKYGCGIFIFSKK